MIGISIWNHSLSETDSVVSGFDRGMRRDRRPEQLESSRILPVGV